MLTNRKRHVNRRKIKTLALTKMSNRDMAKELGIKELTVKWHLTRLYKEIGVSSRREYIRLHLNGVSFDLLVSKVKDLTDKLSISQNEVKVVQNAYKRAWLTLKAHKLELINDLPLGGRND